MSVPRVDLQTNIPRIVTPKYIDFRPNTDGRGGKFGVYPDQISINGDWEDGEQGVIYLHCGIEQRLSALGVIGQRNDQGKYQLLIRGCRLRLLKREGEKNKKYTDIDLVDEHGTVISGAAVNQSRPPQQAVPASRGQSTPAGPTQTGPRTMPGEDAKKAFWAALERTTGECIKLAKKLLKDEGGTPDAVAFVANGLLAEVARRDMWRLPLPEVKLLNNTQLELIADLSAKLGWEDETLANELVDRFKCEDIHKLSGADASKFIADLQRDVAVKLAAPVAAAPLYQSHEDIPF